MASGFSAHLRDQITHPARKFSMTNYSKQRLLAEKLFMPIVNSAGASSITVTSAFEAIKDKSARLKALRLARDAQQRTVTAHPS